MHPRRLKRASNSVASAPGLFHGGRRTLASVVTVVGMIATAWVAAHWLQIAPATAATVDAVRSAGPIPVLRAYLEGQPCDRQKVIALGDRYLQEGQYVALLARAQAFTAACGPYPRLQWQVYDAHRQLGQWKDAAAVASKLIETDPDDKDYWWWRGLANEKQGALEAAAHDYRQALVRMPWLDHIPFNLAHVLEQMDRPCEAIAPLQQFIVAHPAEQRVVQARIDGLMRRGGGCRNVAVARRSRRAR